MKVKLLPSLAVSALLFTTMMLVSGCNTMEGAGKDIEKAGDKIEDAARRNK